jgi:hypothetical protein
VLLGNQAGFAAYDILQDTSTPVRLPYCIALKDKRYDRLHARSDPVITVAPSSPLEDHVRCVIYSGYYVHLVDVPLSFAGSTSMIMRHHLPDNAIQDCLTGSLSTTAGIIGFRPNQENSGHVILVIRAAVSHSRGALRLGCREDEWVSTGLLLRDTLQDHTHWDISLDDDGQNVLVVFRDRNFYKTQARKPSKLALLSLLD